MCLSSSSFACYLLRIYRPPDVTRTNTSQATTTSFASIHLCLSLRTLSLPLYSPYQLTSLSFTYPCFSSLTSFSPPGLCRVYQRRQGVERSRQGTYTHQVRGGRIYQQPHICVRQLLQPSQSPMGVLLLPLLDEELLLHRTGREGCE